MESMPYEFVIACPIRFYKRISDLRRDVMLEAVCKTVPEIYKFCHWSYCQTIKPR